jgi:hypothetical protein
LFAEEAIMRTIVLVAIALAGMSLTSTFADAGRPRTVAKHSSDEE